MGKYNLTEALLEEGLACGDIAEGVDLQGRHIYSLQTKTKDDTFNGSKTLKWHELSDAMMGFKS